MPSHLSLPKLHISFLEVGKKKCNTLICLGEEPCTYMSDSRESFQELAMFTFSKSNENPSF
jgi:hypothetical protein